MKSLNRQSHRVFYGWWIVAVFVFIASYVFGVITCSFTAFIGPLAQEFGWSYTEISIAASLRGLEGSFLAPVIGYFVDRWDAKKMVLAGVAVVGLGFLLLSQVSSLWTFYLVFILIGLGVSTIYPILPVAVVGKWFKKNLATATGILVSGGVLGGLMVPLVTQMIEIYSWRMTLIIFGMGVWIILLPLALLVRSSPEKYGYLPDGDMRSKPGSIKDEPASEIKEVHTNVGKLLKNRAFWHLSIATMFMQLIASSVGVHVMPYLNSIGIDRSSSSFVAGAIPLVSVLGRLSSGWFGDRLDKRKVAAVSLLLVSLSMLIAGYFYTVSTWLIVVFVVLFGIGWGGMIPMHMALLREYCDKSKIGIILGISMGITAIGGITGPPLIGWVFDRFGSYQYCWFAFIGVAILSGVILLTTPIFNKIADTK